MQVTNAAYVSRFNFSLLEPLCTKVEKARPRFAQVSLRRGRRILEA